MRGSLRSYLAAMRAFGALMSAAVRVASRRAATIPLAKRALRASRIKYLLPEPRSGDTCYQAGEARVAPEVRLARGIEAEPPAKP
jgi:hypothetical protein